jgi:hypothetical protein
METVAVAVYLTSLLHRATIWYWPTVEEAVKVPLASQVPPVAGSTYQVALPPPGLLVENCSV